MKIKFTLLIVFSLISISAISQFQYSVAVANEHFHDLNVTPLMNSTDYIVSGNFFDVNMQNEEIFLKRVDQNGAIVWIQNYNNPSFSHARAFDVVSSGNFIIMTGSIDVGGTKRVFIAKFLESTGAFFAAEFYTIVSPSFNARGLKIKYTERDATGDGTPDPGFIVAGFYSDCYAVDINCVSNNIGFVLRTDINLVQMWTTEIDGNNTINTLEMDFANDITETIDGYFITGSATGNISGSSPQQGVLAHKLDFFGNLIWDQSYIFGNSRDLSVDAYYDTATNEIFMLANYSNSHYFGVTVFDNTTGAINFSKSWYASGASLNRYGFRIMESISNPANLIITGYDRDENYVDAGGVSQFGQSTLFVYEFAKANGVQVGPSYQFLAPHVEPIPDEFNFWNSQMPLMYYPDISFDFHNGPGTSHYYHVGYRTALSATFTEAELYKTTDVNLRNQCEHLLLSLTPNPIVVTAIPVISGSTPTTQSAFTLNQLNVSFTRTSCDPLLSVNDEMDNKIEMYPNPAGDEVFFTTANLKSFILKDTLGRTVDQGSLTPEASINVTNLTSGLYFVYVFNDLGKMQTFKLLKK